MKVQEDERAEPCGPGQDRTLGGQAGAAGTAWLAVGPWQPQALAPRAPSLSGALFLCRETRKLPFDCGSPRTGLGARQRGSEWQRGKGCAPPAPAACRVRSPPGAAAEAAAAVAPARRQHRGKRAAPAGRAERSTSGCRARPRFHLVLTTERDAELWNRTGLVHHTEPTAGEWPEKGLRAAGPSPLRTKFHSTCGSPRLWGRWQHFFFREEPSSSETPSQTDNSS